MKKSIMDTQQDDTFRQTRLTDYFKCERKGDTFLQNDQDENSIFLFDLLKLPKDILVYILNYNRYTPSELLMECNSLSITDKNIRKDGEYKKIITKGGPQLIMNQIYLSIHKYTQTEINKEKTILLVHVITYRLQIHMI